MLGVLGDLVEDIVVWLEEPVQRATDTKASVHRTRGGSAANVAAFAGSQYPTRFLGCVGQDASGTWLADELASHGVDVKVQRAGVTGTIVVLIDERGERAMFPQRGAAGLLTDLDEAWVADLEHLHVPAYSFSLEPLGSTASALIRQVHERRATVSIDASSTGMLGQYGPQRFRRLLADLMPRFLFANRAEAVCLGVIDESERLLDDLPQTTLVVKDGDRPTTVLVPQEEAFQVPVPPVDEVRDMTGAGDAFAAGFLTDLLRRGDLRSACVAGHATAARVLRTAGASLPGD